MSVLDIISSETDVDGSADFEAAAPGALYVQVNSPVNNGLPFSDSSARQFWEPGDNLLLQRLDINIPYGFGQAVGKHTIGINWFDTVNNVVINIPELSGASGITVPDLCGMDFAGPGGGGLLVQAPKNDTGQRYQLRLSYISLNVSMLGLPTELAGLQLWVQYHLRVLHTKSMQITVGV